MSRYEPEATSDPSFMPVRVRAHLGEADLPDELLLSVRCLVEVEGGVLLCETPDNWHPWPGGRREAGESHFETAAREVWEETGWTLAPQPFRLLGWLHIEHLEPMPATHPFPHPDFLQIVYAGAAVPGSNGAAEWADVEGHELRTRVVTVQEAIEVCAPELLAHVFLGRLLTR